MMIVMIMKTYSERGTDESGETNESDETDESVKTGKLYWPVGIFTSQG